MMRRGLAIGFIFVALLSCPTVWAVSTVTAIEVRGNRRVEKEAVLGNLETKVGMPYSAERVRRDLNALYRMGAFQDVRVERESTAGGVRLVYIVEERSNIARISFEGNKKVKEEKLRELIEVKPYSSSEVSRLSRSVEKIRDHYAQEGYHLAEIKTEFRPLPGTEDQELLFVIREGEAVRIRRIHFIGNKAFSDRALKKTIKSREKGYWSWLSGGGKYQEEMAKFDVTALLHHYQNHGYLRAKVSAPKVYLSRDRRGITMTFHVTEGEKFKVGKIGVDGEILTTREEILTKVGIKGGEVYSRKKVEADLAFLSQIYGDQGYAFANIQPLIEPNDELRTADVTYRIQKGPRVFIERINISGNTITRDKVIRREILLTENSLYHESRLRQSHQRLMALGYFEEVNFATPRGSSDDRIHLNITVKEKPTGTFSIGAGFSSAENFIFTAQVSKENFFGYGVSGQFSTELSSKRQLFVLSLEDPYFLDSQWIFGLSGFRTVNVFTDFDRRSFGGSLSLGHRVMENSVFRFGYQIEDVSVGDFQTVVPAVFTRNLSGLTSSTSVSLTRDTRNNRLFATKGMFQSVATEFAGLGGDNEFFRVTENFRFYQPIWKSIVGKFNFTIAQVSSLSSLPVPLFERYFMGGVNSLRGYFLRSIGPSVLIPAIPQGGDNRFVFGGNKMLQFNWELEFPIYDPAGFRFVSFIDSGNTFSEEENFSLKDLRSDYGFGLRWNSPLGPLRFEWGFPINKQSGEDPVIFNFTIGSFF